ncbi:MAG: hypothetical protein ACWA41_07060 [Putridiphycobacter sp.]
MKFKHYFVTAILLIAIACGQEQKKEIEIIKEVEQESPTVENPLDDRISLNLNPKQKNHQLKNMRSHLMAVQSIISLLANDEYEEASTVAYTKLGTTTEMKLMCASFGNEQFESMGMAFHQSADEMSETFLKKDKTESLLALSNTMNYCVQCHETFKQ